MPYRQLREPYYIENTESGIVGTKTYIDDPAGTVASLPVIGDPFSVDYQGCKVRGIRREKYDVKAGGTDGFIYTLTYNSNDGGTSYRDVDKKDPDQIAFTGGICEESLDIPLTQKAPQEYFWAVDFDAVWATKSDRSFKYYVPNGSFTKTIEIDEGNWNNQLQIMLDRIGMLNMCGYNGASTFFGFKKGTVMFASWNSSLKLNENGKRVYILDLSFVYRILHRPYWDVGVQKIETNVEWSWLYFLNPNVQSGNDDSVWQLLTTEERDNYQKPSVDWDPATLISTVNYYVFQACDLTKLFSLAV